MGKEVTVSYDTLLDEVLALCKDSIDNQHTLLRIEDCWFITDIVSQHVNCMKDISVLHYAHDYPDFGEVPVLISGFVDIYEIIRYNISERLTEDICSTLGAT